MNLLDLRRLTQPVICAPMAGGPSTPELVSAVGAAGGLGMLAAGYKQPAAVEAEVAAVRAAGEVAFGVNVFVPVALAAGGTNDSATAVPLAGSPAAATAPVTPASPVDPVPPAALASYQDSLRAEADELGVSLGVASGVDDDHFAAKIDLLCRLLVPVVSFTFGSPPSDVVTRLHEVGTTVLVTVTSVAEAVAAQERGADALVVQGVEAGGHRGGLDCEDSEGLGLLPLLRLVAARSHVPLIAAGGLADGAAIAATLVAGAVAAQLGTAFLACPEAGTNAVHRAEIGGGRDTVPTRAFTGRWARALRNDFVTRHADAPAGYPQIHQLTGPLRARALAERDPERLHLWAGQAHSLSRAMPAGELVRVLGVEARKALATVTI